MASNPYDPMAPMQAQVTQQQRMADVMRMQSLQPIQNVGASPLSEISPFQGLAQVMGAYASNKMQDRATEAQTNMVQAMQSHTNQGLEQYMSEYQGDPRGAVMRAMQSPSPVVRDMAKQELKGLMTPKTMASHATDASVIASGGNSNQFQALNKLDAFAPGSLLKGQDGRLVKAEGEAGALPKVVDINGNLMHETSTGLDPVLKAPHITTNNTVNNTTPVGETSFEKNFGLKESERLSAEIGHRSMRIDSIQAAKDGLRLLDEGIHTGLFANMKKNLDKGYGTIAGKEPEKAARTEQFVSHIGNLVTAGLKLFGGSDTVEEMEYLKKIMAGDITMEPKALRNVLQAWQQKYEAKVAETDRAVEAIRGRGNSLPTIDRGVPHPAKQEAGPMSFDDYMKNLGN